MLMGRWFSKVYYFRRIFTGISALEKSNFSAKVEGLDNDISVRTSYLLSDGQFGSNLKLAKDAALRRYCNGWSNGIYF